MQKSKASILKYQEILVLHKVSFSWSAFPLNTSTATFLRANAEVTYSGFFALQFAQGS